MDNEAKAKPPPRKLNPYPIEATLDHGGAKKPVEILYLTHSGFIAKADKIFVHVGEHCQIQFELPVVKHWVVTHVCAMKTYDKSINPKEHKVERIAEFQFEKLSDEQKGYVSLFLSAFGQTK